MQKWRDSVTLLAKNFIKTTKVIRKALNWNLKPEGND